MKLVLIRYYNSAKQVLGKTADGTHNAEFATLFVDFLTTVTEP